MASPSGEALYPEADMTVNYDDYSASIDSILAREFPRKSKTFRIYMRHRVCRFIRNFKNDNWGVVIGAKPVSAGQYTNDDVINIRGVKVYISISVD